MSLPNISNRWAKLTSLNAQGLFMDLSKDTFQMTEYANAPNVYVSGSYVGNGGRAGNAPAIAKFNNDHTVNYVAGTNNLVLDVGIAVAPQGLPTMPQRWLSANGVRTDSTLTSFQTSDRSVGLVPKSDPGTMWVDDTYAIGCCVGTNTSSSATPCGTYENVNNAPSPGCSALIGSVCSVNWDDSRVKSGKYPNGCSDYFTNLNYSQGGSEVIKNTVKNQIARKGDYVSSRDSKDPFYVNVLPNLCNAVDGVCDDILPTFCAQFVRSDLSNDPTLAGICGCYMSESKDCAPSTLPSLPGIQNTIRRYNQYPTPVGKNCDPLCSRAKIHPKGWSCNNTICVVENVGITQKDSKGNINLNVNCGSSSGGGSSVCYIDDLTVNMMNTSANNVNISQKCGSCFDNAGNQIDCASGNIKEPYTSVRGTQVRKRATISASSIIGSIIFFYFLFVYLFNKKGANLKYFDIIRNLKYMISELKN